MDNIANIYTLIKGWNKVKEKDKEDLLKVNFNILSEDIRDIIYINYNKTLLLSSLYILFKMENKQRYEDCILVKKFIDDVINYFNPQMGGINYNIINDLYNTIINDRTTLDKYIKEHMLL